MKPVATTASMFDDKKPSGPVECLGRTFENDDARRAYFLDKLREKLQDPEFCKIEGFPIGTDEDILALSDPPYYTACPNPFLEEFIKRYGKPYDPNVPYNKEPFAADVSEGKNDPIYNVHSYHTKVPHKAIMRYILRYTEPGDVVFDGFCGTGMTGVAAQLCGDKSALAELGFAVGSDGMIRDAQGETIAKIGSRVAVLNDLSPAATLIAAGYNLTTDPNRFAKLAGKLLDRFESDYGWMYQTVDPKSQEPCPINFMVWSEIFTCPQCSGEIEFWSLAYNEESGQIAGKSNCPHCGAEITKRDLVRKTTTYFDPAVKTTRKRQVLKPVLINYACKGLAKQKTPDDADLDVLKRAEAIISDIAYPTDLMMFVPEGEEWGDLYRNYHIGIARVHDFHQPRQLAAFSILWQMGNELPDTETQRLWRFTLQSVMASFTRRNRFLKNAFSQVNRSLSGTLYVGSTVSEPSPRYVLSGKIKRFSKAIPNLAKPVAITTQSLASMLMLANSVDYVFIDPPFGDNLPYAELNFLWEAWLRVFTRATQDAVISGKQHKDLAAYNQLMTECLKEVYRVLKPGRWVTVEFHNSKNAVWAAIQESLGRAGFIIADVHVLNKGMLTKKQLSANAVDKDLVISAYKPNSGLESRFKLEAGTEEGAWDFARTHLRQLPVCVVKEERVELVAERMNYLLFDRMVAFHVQRGVTVPFSAPEFYAGLTQRFAERDGMYFLAEQVVEYDKTRARLAGVQQLSLFVSDEASAVQWLRQTLSHKPQTYSDLFPQFVGELRALNKHEKLPELSQLLEQNFIRYDGMGDVPSQIHAYLSTNYKDLRGLSKNDPSLRARAKDRWYVPDPNKAADLEKVREKALLREFDEYRETKQRKLKVFRLEAVRVGFRKAWQDKDYATIIDVAHRIPENVLQEDPKLLMWYDQASLRAGHED